MEWIDDAVRSSVPWYVAGGGVKCWEKRMTISLLFLIEQRNAIIVNSSSTGGKVVFIRLTPFNSHKRESAVEEVEKRRASTRDGR